MSYKAKVYAVGTELEFEETSLKEMWKRLAFFQSLPDTCPIDDTPTRLFYKEPEGNSYFSVVSSGQLHFEYKLGQYKEAKDDLFGKGEWWWWDYTNKVDVLLCKWGELTPEGEAMRERCKGSAPVAHKGPQATQSQQTANRTAQHRNAPQRPANPVTREIESITVDGVGALDDSWDSLTKLADDNRAADAKAKAPFVWPVSEEALELCTGLYNSPDCPKRVVDLSNYIAKRSVNSNPMSEKQYGFLTSLVDKRYGGGHNAILSACCQHIVNSEHRPGFGAKELIDWLKEPEANTGKIAVLDALVDSLKQDLSQFELA